MNKDNYKTTVLEDIKKMHFDYKTYVSESEANKEEFGVVLTSSDNHHHLEQVWEHAMENDREHDFPVLSDHATWSQRLNYYVGTRSKKEDVSRQLTDDQSLFSHVVTTFRALRYRTSSVTKLETPPVVACIDALKRNGIYKWEKYFDDDQLQELIGFQEWYIKAIGEDAKVGGKLYIHLNSQGHVVAIGNDKSMPQHGELRCQSKSLGFHPPGVEKLAHDAQLITAAREWMKNPSMKIWRSTISLVHPSDGNHIPWHIDTYKDQLKVFVLLDDVTHDNAPMYYAMGSNRISTEHQSITKHTFFKHNKTDTTTSRSCNGWVKDNSGDVIDHEPVTIDTESYDKFVTTGKKGDIIFFDVSGYHSGNKVRAGNRKVLVISFPNDSTFMNSYMSHVGK